MKHVLSRENAAALEGLAASRVLLAFDFDGTLAAIVDRPDQARMRAETAGLFARLCELYPCAVISGRGRADMASRLDGAAVKCVVGNHGLEPGGGLDEFEREMRDTRRLLEAALQGEPGVDLEDKRYSLAVHYRRARRKRSARAAIARAISSLPAPMRVVPGKLVVNLLPERAPHKGDALLGLRVNEGAQAVLYVGDDVTDEDVFKLDQAGWLLTVRVGWSAASAAAYFLRSQREIDRLLARLIALRDPPDRR